MIYSIEIDDTMLKVIYKVTITMLITYMNLSKSPDTFPAVKMCGVINLFLTHRSHIAYM